MMGDDPGAMAEEHNLVRVVSQAEKSAGHEIELSISE